MKPGIELGRRLLGRFIAPLSVVAVLAGCAQPVSRDAVTDPLEGLNRVSHGVNKATDAVVIRPASQVYGRFTPGVLRQSVDNFAGNLSQPSYFVNDMLQGQIDDAGHNLFRFLINTTIGLGGLFDPARSFGLDARRSDFGQTLYSWGVGEGAYFELPLLGPSTGRHTVGRIVDAALDPVGQVTKTVPERQARRTLQFVDRVGDRHSFHDNVDSILYDSVDSYSQARSVYLQSRRFFLMGAEGESALGPEVDPFDDPFAVPVSP